MAGTVHWQVFRPRICEFEDLVRVMIEHAELLTACRGANHVTSARNDLLVEKACSLRHTHEAWHEADRTDERGGFSSGEANSFLSRATYERFLESNDMVTQELARARICEIDRGLRQSW